MKFQITFKATGEIAKYRANDWTSFEEQVFSILNYVNLHNTAESDFEFVVEGKIVSLDLAWKEAINARNEFEEKRAKTHKQIWIRTGGVTNARANFRQIWVKK